ncbi:hypothetical protein [Alteromonas sp. CYL-A6]|uniref:hypothetical protein n=1 Tax=Alteromonas nitratireducens TaxID=3390813 RepID=UPI0034B046D4
MKSLLTCLLACLALSPALVRAELHYADKTDLQVRHDMRSNRASRDQYRIRYYPSLSLSAYSSWSLNAFAVTGDDFSASHNTFGESDQGVHVRRLYLRHQADYGKTEFGVIPTYKGRVSSSGLSKDGWIEGLRHVRLLPDDSQLELVVGQLNNTQPGRALSLPDKADYIELEYSARIDQSQSYEFSLERMTGGNFARAEYRHRFTSGRTAFAELVHRLDESGTKAVVGLSGEFHLGQYPVSFFTHYSYVSDGLGARAELTEDFLGTGHGASAEFDGVLSHQHRLDWFVRIDVIDSVSRLLTGIKLSFAHGQ